MKEEIEKPIIYFQNESIEIGDVKAKAWRETAKIKTRDENTIITIEDMIKYIVSIFDDERVTSERIENEVNIEKIYPLFLNTYSYVLALVSAGLSKVNDASKKNEVSE